MIFYYIHLIADKAVPNTPLRELIRQTPVITVCAVFLFTILCTLILGIYVVKKCYEYRRDKLKNPDRRDCDSTHKLDKDLNKNPNGMFSSKSTHIKEEDTKFIGNLVDKVMGTVQQCTSGTHQLQGPRLHSRRRQNDPESGHGLEEQRSQSDSPQQQPDTTEPKPDPLSKGSHTVTTFLANKVYTGLKHPTHGKKFRRVVKKLLKKTTKGDISEESDSESDGEAVPLVKKHKSSVPRENGGGSGNLEGANAVSS